MDRMSKQRTASPLFLSLQMSASVFLPKLMTCEHHELKLSLFSLSSQELFLISGRRQRLRQLRSTEFLLPPSFPRCSGLCDSIAATLTFPHYLATSMSNPGDLARHFCQCLVVYTPHPSPAAPLFLFLLQFYASLNTEILSFMSGRHGDYLFLQMNERRPPNLPVRFTHVVNVN